MAKASEERISRIQESLEAKIVANGAQVEAGRLPEVVVEGAELCWGAWPEMLLRRQLRKPRLQEGDEDWM